jgi:hypothetical protein
MIFIIKKNIFFFSQNLQKCPSGVGHSKAVGVQIIMISQV